MPEAPSARLGLIATSVSGDALRIWPAQLQAIVALLDAKTAMADAGARGSRPVSTAISPGIVNRLYRSADGGIDWDTGTSWATVRPGLFAAFPTASGTGAGIDVGMEVLLQTAGMEAAGQGPWRCRYDAALSGSDKWRVMSADPITNVVDAQESTPASTTSYSDLTTVGPAVTVPKSGIYTIDLEAWMIGTGTDMSFVVTGGAADVDDHVAGTGSVSRSGIERSLAAGEVVTAKYRSVGGVGTFEHRLLRLTPVRIR